MLLVGFLALSQSLLSRRLGEDGEVYKGGLLGAVRTWEGGIFTLHHRQGSGQSMKAPGGFTGGAVKTMGTGWGLTAASAQTRDQIRQHVGALGGGRWLQLDCSHSSGRFAPMYPFYLFITYKLGVRLTLLKANRAGQRMEPPDRAVGEGGELGRRNLGAQGRLWLQQWKGQEAEGWGGASLQDSPSPEIPPLLWLSTSF